MADNKKIIEAHLKKVAAQDPVFAEKLTDPKKSIDKCFQYIQSQARKAAVNGCAMIEDEVVYGWAVHYYCEEQPEIPSSAAVKIESVKVPTEAKKAAQNKEKAPQKQEKASPFIQLSLF